MIFLGFIILDGIKYAYRWIPYNDSLIASIIINIIKNLEELILLLMLMNIIIINKNYIYIYKLIFNIKNSLFNSINLIYESFFNI
jgi:hypothetical protein